MRRSKVCVHIACVRHHTLQLLHYVCVTHEVLTAKRPAAGLALSSFASTAQLFSTWAVHTSWFTRTLCCITSGMFPWCFQQCSQCSPATAMNGTQAIDSRQAVAILCCLCSGQTAREPVLCPTGIMPTPQCTLLPPLCTHHNLDVP